MQLAICNIATHLQVEELWDTLAEDYSSGGSMHQAEAWLYIFFNFEPPDVRMPTFFSRSSIPTLSKLPCDVDTRRGTYCSQAGEGSGLVE
jgi:hypothetical protein